MFHKHNIVYAMCVCICAFENCQFQKMKFSFKTYISFLFGLFSLILINASSESFNEELLIKPLPTGHVYSFFQFITKWDVDPEETQREPAIFFLEI